MDESDPTSGSANDSRDKWITIDRLCDAYEASLQEQDGHVERAAFMAGVPSTWREQLRQELDAIDAAYHQADDEQDARETRDATVRFAPDDPAGRRLPSQGRLAELASLDKNKAWLGRFEIERRLGSGATGSVWCARDARLARWVALKVPHATRMMSENTATRFQTEARAAAAITHPNVVQVHEVLMEEGLPILIQQWIDGPTLAEYLKENGPLDFDLAAEWMIQISDAVACAHDKQVVHRDLKPANIMLNENRPMVLDFGLASYPPSATDSTCDGTVIGTPAYMSPEQANADESACDPPTDLYSMGAILYEMLVGTPPFVGKTSEVLEATREVEPAPLRNRRSGIPRDLETIALRCLKKKPAMRYASAADLRDDLKRYLNREPIKARKVNRIESVWVWTRQHPAKAISMVGLPLVFALVAGVVFSQLERIGLSNQANRLFRSQRDNATERIELLSQRHMIQLARASQELGHGDRMRGIELMNSIPPALRDWEWNLLQIVSKSPSFKINSGDSTLSSNEPLQAMVVSRPHRKMFAATSTGSILKWELPSMTALFRKDPEDRAPLGAPEIIFIEPEGICEITISPDHRYLSWVTKTGSVVIWNLDESERVCHLKPDRKGPGYALRFSPDGQLLIAAGAAMDASGEVDAQKSWLRIYGIDATEEFPEIVSKRWEANRPAIRAIEFVSATSFVLARGFDDGTASGGRGFVEVWSEGPRGWANQPPCWSGACVTAMTYHAEENLVAWADKFNLVHLARPRYIKKSQQLFSSPEGISKICFSPGGGDLRLLGDNGGVSRWKITEKKTEPAVVETEPEIEVETETLVLEDIATPDSAPSERPPESGSPSNLADAAAESDPAKEQVLDEDAVAIQTPAEESFESAEQALPDKVKAGVPRYEVVHLEDYGGHSRHVRDGVFLTYWSDTPQEKMSSKETRMNNSPPYWITCGEDGQVLQWASIGHPSIGTTRLGDRTVVDAKWISPHQLAVATKSHRNFVYGYASNSRHPIDIDTRHVPRPTSIVPPARNRSLFDDAAEFLATTQVSAPPPCYAVCCRDRVLVFEAGNLQLKHKFAIREYAQGVIDSACLLDSRWLIVAATVVDKNQGDAVNKKSTPDRQTQLFLFDQLQVDSPPLVRTLEGISAITKISLSPDQSNLFASTTDGTMVVLPIRSRDSMGLTSESPLSRSDVVASTLVSSNQTELINIVEDPIDQSLVDTSFLTQWFYEPIDRWAAHDDKISDFAWISHAGNLATVSQDGTCALWRWPSTSVSQGTQLKSLVPELEHRLLVSGGGVTRVTASALSDRIATLGQDRAIRIWDTTRGLELISLESKKQQVLAIEFSPNDRFLMIAERDSRIRCIELKSERSPSIE